MLNKHWENKDNKMNDKYENIYCMVDDVKNDMSAKSLAEYLVINFPEYAEELCDHLIMQIKMENLVKEEK